MARKVGYLFGTENDLDRALLSSRITLGINTTNQEILKNRGRVVFAQVDDGQSGKDVTATEVAWNATSEDWEAPPGTPWKWDTANVANDYTTTNLQSHQDLSAGDVVEVTFYTDKSETEQWLARTSGGGSDIVYIEITASTDINTYTGTIYNNPIDRTIVEAGVTVKAMQHDAGTIPNSGAGEGFFCYKNGDNYYITNYAVFYG